MGIILYVFVAALFLVVVSSFARRSRDYVRKLRGPPSPSWLLGNEVEIRNQSEVGDLDFPWVREYGATFNTRGTWGKRVVFTCDPRALQHIFHTKGYHYPKRADAAQATRNILGRGIMWASGDTHQRHRKVMNPAFTAQQLRAFLPLFQSTASRMTQKWKDLIQAGEHTFNVSRWLARSTLDAIGEAAFDYRFGAIDSAQNPLSKSMENLFSDTLLYPSGVDLLFKGLWQYIPTSILQYVEYIPTKEYIRFRAFRKLAKSVSKGLIEQRASVSMGDGTSRDVMSVLVRANVSEDPKGQLDEDEILSQMATIILAGYETTALTLAWLLYELSKHPEDQKMMREEIRELRAKLPRGTEFTMLHLDSLTFTIACMKEVLRLYPIVPALVRTAERDDVLPLALPIVTKDGETLTELPIQKGQDFIVSICAYNRLPSVWGSDADEWNPRRFLDTSKEKQTSVGVYANLMTFSGGVQACIGWRFAVIELQALLVEAVENFKFVLPKGVEIMRLPAGIMVPMVRGKMSEGTQMPLQVSLMEE
ncbi:hypothetical protein PC9H_003765 [Pleurotus ostreatus]|uniref:Cytochrome P450 n=1 Tax=Pleurotus ostreatus TaxID=5322 RepID=A0A8H7A2Z2_PLEOS|nr:uncharacterized protein PC9H_003765 [Pleurotus ostreatus]KAF7436931.1 hypothetical protein PC9H_003765 [Pleurotus ostreatus]